MNNSITAQEKVSYEEFETQLTRLLRSELPEDTRIGIEYVERNRGRELRGLTIHRRGEQVSPVIYLEECFRQYQEGMEMAALAADILKVCGCCSAITTDLAEIYEDWNLVKSRIVRRIVSVQDNEALLSEIPHTVYLDLAIIYYCIFESSGSFEAGVLIRREHLHMWDVELSELEAMADQNMPRLCPPAFLTMQEMIGELLGTEFPEEDPARLYVLTNRSKCYGAVYMSDPSVLADIADRLRDDFYVLPSSLHECMIVPAQVQSDEQAMQQMVEEINCTQVLPEEVLGSSVYIYRRSRGKLEIAVPGR